MRKIIQALKATPHNYKQGGNITLEVKMDTGCATRLAKCRAELMKLGLEMEDFQFDTNERKITIEVTRLHLKWWQERQ